jgi:acetylornithine deacetylase
MAHPVGDVAVQLAGDLVRINSVNPSLVPGAPGERQIVESLRRRLAGRGFVVEVVTPQGLAARPSLVARHVGSGGGRGLLLNGHLDTVGVEGMSAPFAAEVVEPEDRAAGDGRLVGRGACDMKSGVAAMVAAAEAAVAAETAGDVVLALVADEEDGSVGTEAVLDRLDVAGLDACLVGEPTWLDLAVAHRGYTVLDVEFAGLAAHSSQPENGVNAVTHLGRFLGRLEELDHTLAQSEPHPLLGNAAAMATVARGGQSPFVLASSASAVVELRTLPGEGAAATLAEIESVLAAMRRDDPGVRATASVRLTRPGWQHDRASAAGVLAELLEDQLEARTGSAPDRVGAPYWMESALWEAAGVPTLVCGPAGGGMHAADEWVDLAQVRNYAEALTGVITAFCGSAG